MSMKWFESSLYPADLRSQIADRYATFAGVRMEASGGGEGGGSEGGAGGGGEDGEGGSFTQADIDAAVTKAAASIRADERRKVTEKYADYDDLKKRAEGAKTAEDRIADLETRLGAVGREALVSKVQARHGISDEDAALYLTGADEEALTAQAKRLSELASDSTKKKSNHVPREGNHSKATGKDGQREFVRDLFGTGG